MDIHKNYLDFILDKLTQPTYKNFDEFRKKVEGLPDIKLMAELDQALFHCFLSSEDKKVVPLFEDEEDLKKLSKYLVSKLQVLKTKSPLFKEINDEIKGHLPNFQSSDDAGENFFYLYKLSQKVRQIVGRIVPIDGRVNINTNPIAKIYLQKTIKLAGGSHYIMENNAEYFTFGSYLFYINLFESLFRENVLKNFMDIIKKHSEEKTTQWIQKEIIDKPMVLPHLWCHQKDALNEWKRERNGIIEMATATGKTLVGLAAIEDIVGQIRDSSKIAKVLIVSQSKNILNQWRRETIEKLGLLGDSSLDYKTPITTSTVKIRFETAQMILQGLKNPQKHNEYNDPEQLLIVDEVHHFAASEFNKVLDIEHKWFMGLSATIGDQKEQIFETRNKAQVIYRFGLKDAIDKEIIPNFCWKIHPVSLDDSEQREFESLTKSINGIIKEILEDKKATDFVRRSLYKDGDSKPITLRDLIDCIERARLQGNIENLPNGLKTLQKRLIERQFILHTSAPKIKLAIDLANRYAGEKKCLIFTMDIKTCDNIASNLKGKFDCVYSIHSNLKPEDVKERLEKFRKVENGALVAAKMLDEGIDIPDAEIAVNVAASKTRLQLIQRMGRILRRDPKNPDKQPIFHHLVAVPRALDRIEYEDDRLLLDNDIWVRDTALKLGLVPTVEPLDQEIEYDVQLEKAMRIRKDFIAAGSAYLANEGTIKIRNIISDIPKELRLDMAIALGEKFADKKSISDQEWMKFVRDFCVAKGRSISYFDGPFWWVFWLAEQSPNKLAHMLKSD